MTPSLVPDDIVLGLAGHIVANVPESDQVRQRRELVEILRRMRERPGVILADEVGMGKTFVALAVATSVALRNPVGPVVVMVPPTLMAKWQQDIKTFCELYTQGLRCLQIDADGVTAKDLRQPGALRYAAVRDGTAFLRLLDDPRDVRAHVVFVSHGAMSRQRMDRWVNLSLIAEALRRHGRGANQRLIEVKRVIHRFLGRLVGMTGRESGHDLGEELWQRLLRTSPLNWKEVHNEGIRGEARLLRDDPVPKAVVRALPKLELRELAEALRQMPIRARGGEDRVGERIDAVRVALRAVEKRIWAEVLKESNWRSPLLVMDEAHHLKNASTQLAKQLQSPELDGDLKTGDGALSNRFDRMLFLTATPFQLGHRELVHVLQRFGDVRWDPETLGDRDAFLRALDDLKGSLDESQRTSIAMQRAWSRMRPADLPSPGHDPDAWWRAIEATQAERLTPHQRAFRDACGKVTAARRQANALLRPWVLRHNKGDVWAGTTVPRRNRAEGAAIAAAESAEPTGLAIPDEQLLPFFLAARAAVNPHKDLLGDALCSSYEAFQYTRRDRRHPQDQDDHTPQDEAERLRLQEELDTALANAWYLDQFEKALGDKTDKRSRRSHPKLAATVRRVADLWECGEKVVVFAFYRHTCAALRYHIGDEIRRRLLARARERMGMTPADDERMIWKRLDQIQQQFFGREEAPRPGQRALDDALERILEGHAVAIARVDREGRMRPLLLRVMRRFLRVRSSLVRCFPLEREADAAPDDLVQEFLDHEDASGMSWRDKFHSFIGFLCTRCGDEERRLILEELVRIDTGDHSASEDEHDRDDDAEGKTLANVGVCSGGTKMEVRVRRMRTFNTPFFPDVLVCSEVMGEGVDLHRFCRHVIHHDLAWNPSD
ncbi:MAG: SNF2-related protein, partial [Planctomycetia bacterium]